MEGDGRNLCFRLFNHCFFIVFTIFIVLNSTHSVRFVGGTDYNDPAVLQLVTEFLYSRLSNMTSFMSGELASNSQFCIKNPEEDWERSFNFSSNMAFLSSCIQKTRGDVTRRLCTKAEIRFYFNNVIEGKAGGANLMLNKNCNLKKWVSGCEPGWGCSIGLNEQVNIENSQTIPIRVYDCDSCCEGFFCPRGLTCMIPCPLGSYCPMATLNKTTGTCEPYGYQLPPENVNHTCGGANIWADVGSSSEVFCSAGSYCPTTTKRVHCSKGHYCKMGSTNQERCFKLTSCNPNSAHQNMHAYGIMVIAALITLLLMFYNCSDQMLTNRARKEAKTREAAAKSARETARAREKWKYAKDTAKKHAFELQSQLSRTFSRKKFVTQTSELKIPVKMNSSLSKSAQLASQSGPAQPVHPPKWKKNEPTDLMKMMRAIEDDHENFDGIILSAGDNNIEKHVVKEKEIHTHSQIFKYAYAQLEREKAYQQQLQQANKHLTFSGVVSLASNQIIKKRPLVEVSFKNLGLILKRKNIHLLRCVSGVIKPGHITAVMGPSGAGKTSLLSALAWKSTGCRTTGNIFINGKAESIHSYKKIVGFVPQDDIVYGNLTVEENLWFSANCRLAADMRKADKVLIVERVIENLGLQSVRDSVVGTVEKRGISGGQRKRVNVGLELVVEPSLLFLDEPTSGLDSSSSQLLLRALRHETLEGLNICMVVHQPSYTLFEMFDDLILLAKGGLPVYHGSAKTAEDYFSKLGIFVPERVNPPDYFIDILEGLVRSGTSSSVGYEDLPVRWMLHNGYTIPSDMQKLAARISESPRAVMKSEAVEVCMENLEQVPEAHKSFVGEMWEGFKYMVEQGYDNMHHVFFKYKDLSTRNTPGIFLQYRYFLGRVGKQRLREARIQAVDYLILLLAGSCLGSLAKVSDQAFGASAYTYTIIAVSLLCKISALRSFSLDKLQYLRERASGISSLAHFLSKDTVDLFNTVVKPVVYLSMFYFFNNPRSSFADNYIVLMCLVYCVSGIAYLLAILFDAGPAQLWSALLPVVLTLIATQPKDGKFLKILANFCYPKWALEAFVISNAERYYGVWLLTRCGSLMKMGYSLHNWNSCIFSLFLAGLVARSLAFFCLLVTFRNK